MAHSRPGAARRDVVTDFMHLEDELDPPTIDARPATAADDAFTILVAPGAAFTGVGQLRWCRHGSGAIVEANLDADPGAELQVELTGFGALSAADFVL